MEVNGSQTPSAQYLKRQAGEIQLFNNPGSIKKARVETEAKEVRSDLEVLTVKAEGLFGMPLLDRSTEAKKLEVDPYYVNWLTMSIKGMLDSGPSLLVMSTENDFFILDQFLAEIQCKHSPEFLQAVVDNVFEGIEGKIQELYSKLNSHLTEEEQRASFENPTDSKYFDKVNPWAFNLMTVNGTLEVLKLLYQYDNTDINTFKGPGHMMRLLAVALSKTSERIKNVEEKRALLEASLKFLNALNTKNDPVTTFMLPVVERKLSELN